MSAEQADPDQSWRCFHCDDVFTRDVDAAEHFGDSMGAFAACQIKGHEHGLIAHIRDLESQLRQYQREDGRILRAMQVMRSEHVNALRRAEETGFDRGVQDMIAHGYCVDVPASGGVR